MLSYRGTGATALPQEATPWQYLKDGKWTPSKDIIIYNLINVVSKVEANVEKGKNKAGIGIDHKQAARTKIWEGPVVI